MKNKRPSYFVQSIYDVKCNKYFKPSPIFPVHGSIINYCNKLDSCGVFSSTSLAPYHTNTIRYTKMKHTLKSIQRFALLDMQFFKSKQNLKQCRFSWSWIFNESYSANTFDGSANFPVLGCSVTAIRATWKCCRIFYFLADL